MHLKVINDVNALNSIRDRWEQVFSRDPHATVFLSWDWMRGWLPCAPGKWLVLSIIDPDAFPCRVAFFALRVSKRSGALNKRVLQLGGTPLADYTGLVCLPGCEEKVIDIIAKYIKRELEWNVFDMRDVCDPRMKHLASLFSEKVYDVHCIAGTPCPYVLLPHDWQQYLLTFLGSATRQSLRRKLRAIKRLEALQTVHVNRHNLQQQIDTLLLLWQMRFSFVDQTTLGYYRSIFANCFVGKRLWLDLIYNGDDPMAGMAAFLDHKHQAFRFYMMGFNEAYAGFSPGKVMVAQSIRYAIEHGFQVYDFLRGDEPYKYSFGCVDRHNTDIRIEQVASHR